MYERHFGFSEKPFNQTPDSRYLFPTTKHQQAFSSLALAVRQGGGGIALLTGEVGTGKTTLIRRFLSQVGPEVRTAVIHYSPMSVGQLFHAILQGLDVPFGGGDLQDAVAALAKAVNEAEATGLKAVVVIDEAQSLPPLVLQKLGLFLDVETKGQKSFTLVLVGQPGLRQGLERRSLRQISGRITSRAHLEALSLEETRRYVRHRLLMAGGAGTEIEEVAISRVHALSLGVPRIVNALCDRALVEAFTRGQKSVGTALVESAALQVLPKAKAEAPAVKPGSVHWLEVGGFQAPGLPDFLVSAKSRARLASGSKLNARRRAILGLTAFTLGLMTTYLCVRLLTLFTTGYSVVDGVMAVLLFGAELFLCLHGVGYFVSVIKAGKQEQRDAPLLFAPFRPPALRPARHKATPDVAVLVAAFNESEEVLEETLASVCALDYPAARVYLVDDSTKAESQEGAARLAATYGAKLVHRVHRAGYKAGAINDLLPHLTETYIALLDADQRPKEAWLKDLIPYMDAQPDLAFVQAPQVYVNTDGLPVAEAAKYQQAVFFEYICEGKSYSNAMFCCGSNVIMRREALLSIETEVKGRKHFFDETSVTEDFATSFRLHAKGWRTDYINQPYVVGMGPETLSAYFTQQMRWAMGTLAVGLSVAGQLLRRPRAMRAAQWWEYLLSGSYYFVGFANFIFMLAPILFVLFDVRPLRTQSHLYLVFFVPYIVFTMNSFFFGMWLRQYSIRGVWLASALSFSTFWIYIKAALVALLGLKRAFGVTPKGVGGSIPLTRMLPELVMLLLNAGVALWGTYQLIIGGWSVAYVMNTFWAGYHTVLLSTLFFYFNRPVTIEPRQLLFEQSDRLAA